MTAETLDARSPLESVWTPAAPAPLRNRESPTAPPNSSVTVTIHRQPIRIAADHQAAVCEIWRRHNLAPPQGLAQDLAAADILRHCGFLQAPSARAPLVFRRIAEETVRVFGTAWAREQLGRPNEADPNSEYALQLAAEYEEAIEGGQPVYNHLVIHGLPRPVIYSHMLVAWTSPGGQRALLACIDWPGL